jgi:hypothetical protein
MIELWKLGQGRKQLPLEAEALPSLALPPLISFGLSSGPLKKINFTLDNILMMS